MKIVRKYWVFALALAGCYGSRAADPNDGLTGNEVSSEPAGQHATGAAGRARDAAKTGAGGTGGAGRSGAAGRAGDAPKTGAGGKSGAGRSGAGGCAAIRTTAAESFDTTGFPDVGGAGAMLTLACQRCGWDADEEICRQLVYKVPTIKDPKYGPCDSAGYDFADCLERESCICDGDVPLACKAAEQQLDECVATGKPSSEPVLIPPGWMDIDSPCHYFFFAPPDYKSIPVQGTDSCVVEFSTASCKYSGDYGAFSGPYTPSGSERDLTKTRVVISGYEAELVRFSTPDGTHHAALHFPWVNGGSRLTMVATCSSQDDSQALQLFRTLRFTLL